jgi:hypothetical protein
VVQGRGLTFADGLGCGSAIRVMRDARHVHRPANAFTFHFSPFTVPLLLLALIQPPIQLESGADKRHMGKRLRKITQLFGRGT